MKSQLLTTKEAANYLGISVSMLARDRANKKEIPHIKIGSRMIKYLKSDLDDYIKSKKCY